MKETKEFFGLIVAVIIVWHLFTAFSSKTTIVGVFKEAPKTGYVWSNNGGIKSRLFWENTKAKWQSGYQHPNYNVVTSEIEGRWTPMAGYVFSGNGNDNLSTVWQENKKHPTMNAYSASDEGLWIPELGYKFMLDQVGNATSTVWNAGEKYENLKITASDKIGYFESFPGYTFTNPKTSLDVVWTPGSLYPTNPEYVASSIEGEWIIKTSTFENPTEPDAGDVIAEGATIAIIGNVGEWIFGKNDITDKIKEKGAEKMIIGGIKALSN